jgi:hypothetical protein
MRFRLLSLDRTSTAAVMVTDGGDASVAPATEATVPNRQTANAKPKSHHSSAKPSDFTKVRMLHLKQQH